jgi:hypothetical protein
MYTCVHNSNYKVMVISTLIWLYIHVSGLHVFKGEKDLMIESANKRKEPVLLISLKKNIYIYKGVETETQSKRVRARAPFLLGRKRLTVLKW